MSEHGGRPSRSVTAIGAAHVFLTNAIPAAVAADIVASSTHSALLGVITGIGWLGLVIALITRPSLLGAFKVGVGASLLTIPLMIELWSGAELSLLYANGYRHVYWEGVSVTTALALVGPVTGALVWRAHASSVLPGLGQVRNAELWALGPALFSIVAMVIYLGAVSI